MGAFQRCRASSMEPSCCPKYPSASTSMCLKVVVDDEGGLRSTGYIAKNQGLFEIDFKYVCFSCVIEEKAHAHLPRLPLVHIQRAVG